MSEYHSPKLFSGCFDETVDIYALGTLSCLADGCVSVLLCRTVLFCALLGKGGGGGTDIKHGMVSLPSQISGVVCLSRREEQPCTVDLHSAVPGLGATAGVVYAR